MPTYPLTLASGARVRLSAPQWQLLCTIVTVLDTRPMLTAFLARDLWPALSRAARSGFPGATMRMLSALEDLGVLERIKAGYRLAQGVREQVPG